MYLNWLNFGNTWPVFPGGQETLMKKAYMIRYRRRRQKGITAVEVMVVLAVIAILMSFSGSFAGSLTGKANLIVAEEHVLDALQVAKNLSRSSESSTTLSFSREAANLRYRISFKGSEGQQTGPRQMDAPVIHLPDGITVLSETTTFTFDHRGLVEPTGSIVLGYDGKDNEIRTVVVR
jgi:prepilin-type N-terminal cleavage/methylation domain-containing protein